MRYAIGVRGRHWQATVTKYREHCCIFFEYISLELGHLIFACNVREVMQQTSSDPATHVVFFDNKCNLCAFPTRDIATQSNDGLLRLRADRSQQDDRAYVIDLC